MNAANTLAAGTTLSGGTLNAGNNNALAGGTVTVNGGILNFTTATPAVTALAGSGGSIVLSSGTLSIGGGNVSTTYSGTIGQAAANTGSVTKVGSGSQVLAGNNTYTGGTIVSNGSLLATNGRKPPARAASRCSRRNAWRFGLIAPTGGNSVTIQSGGILAPHTTASGYSTLTINGP